MQKFEILCVTMNQNDFSKIKLMNVRSNIVFANQDNRVNYEEFVFDSYHTAKMITTNTKGVGNNRNISLIYATGDICLLSDDDMCYADDVENIVISEFSSHPDADVIIFNIQNESRIRPEYINKRTRWLTRFNRMPYGAVRIAFKKTSIIKENLCFNSLFGGGCIYQAGEDSLFLKSIFAKKLKVLASPKIIGKTNTNNSTWFKGYNEAYYYSKGAFLAASKKAPCFFWMLYYCFRTKKESEISFKEGLKFMRLGREGYKDLLSFDDIQKIIKGKKQ